MFRYLNYLMVGCGLVLLSGCSSFWADLQGMELFPQQHVDDLAPRSVNFRPQYQLKVPAREELSEREKKMVGAPPPPKGVVLLDGTRYYSGNGHVCQLFKDTRYKKSVTASPKSACFINGRWVLAAPVLNSPNRNNY